MRHFLLIFVSAAISIMALKASDETLQPDELSQSDLNFLFETINFENDTWTFKLSKSTEGMKWSIRGDKTNQSGTCVPGVELSVTNFNSLSIQKKDLIFSFSPIDPKQNYYRITLIVKPENNLSSDTESRQAWLGPASSPSRGVKLLHPRL
jgi:hypothetical protein